ncbi:beta-1,3-glucanase family protein [Simkania sp.]|uniref:beta-1,3-glucanase family protein n=1 Tax=Simkania sp. TaxID=34094 RepID=UPI003B521D94
MNSSNLNANQVYFVAHGNDPDGFPCFLVPDASGVCQFVYPTADGTPSSASVSVTLDQLPAVTGTPFSNAYLVYLPINASSRAYLSINYPMYLGTSINPALGVMGVDDASVTSRNDPNFYTLYQDFEFGLDNSVTDSTTQLFLNLSWVDYFCLPMQLATYSYPSNQQISTADTYASGTETSLTREDIITQMNAGLSETGVESYPSWQYLDVPFYDNPYTDSTPSSCVRILAAKNSIDLGESPLFQGGKNPPQFFPSTYGTDSTNGPQAGKSFYQAVYDYYLTNTLYAQVFPAKEPAETYTITSVSGQNLVLSFAAQSSSSLDVTIDLNDLPFDQMLSGSVWPFIPASVPAAYTNELSKLISALFTIGQLPYTASTTSPTTPFVNNNGGYSAIKYFINPPGYSNGPWYNLYDIVLHELQINQGKVQSNPTLGLGYGYDFDDLLNMSGIINGIAIQDSLGNPSQDPEVTEPYIVITLLSLTGTNIPDLAANNQAYNVTMGPAGGGVDVSFTYYNGSSTQTTSASSTENTILGSVQVDDSNPFVIKFTFDGTDYEYHINLQNQAVLPSTATSTYSATDQHFLNSIVFSATGSPPEFTITYNSSPPPWAG